MLRTRENSDVFNSLDEIYLVFTSKKQISSISHLGLQQLMHGKDCFIVFTLGKFPSLIRSLDLLIMIVIVFFFFFFFFFFFQLLLNFLQEVERSAILTEHFQRWEVSVQTSRDICMTLETFIRISPIVVKSKRKDTILRESLMRVARCGLEMVNGKLLSITKSIFFPKHIDKVIIVIHITLNDAPDTFRP